MFAPLQRLIEQLEERGGERGSHLLRGRSGRRGDRSVENGGGLGETRVRNQLHCKAGAASTRGLAHNDDGIVGEEAIPRKVEIAQLLVEERFITLGRAREI